MPGSKVKEIKIDERELEELLVRCPDAIEDNMKILGRQIRTDSGPLDILAVDEDGALTVIELKDEVDDGQLDQGLRYYDWVRTNIQWLYRYYEGVDPDQEPRLILVAPAFSENLRRIAKYVNVNLDLIEYHAIRLPDGGKGILCRPLEVGRPPEPPVVPTREGHLRLIVDDKVRQLCAECLKELEGKGVEVRPLQDYWFSMWYKGRRFMYLGCKKKFFACLIQRSNGSWTGRIRITTKEDWEKAFNDEIAPIIQKIESS
ncbi:MAG: endonuclease NucS [Nitrososphaerota archaeon]